MTSLQNLFVETMKVATKKISQTLFLLYEPFNSVLPGADMLYCR